MIVILVVAVIFIVTLGLSAYSGWRILLVAIKQAATIAYVKGWTDAMEMRKQWDVANTSVPNMQVLADYLLARIPTKVRRGMMN